MADKQVGSILFPDEDIGERREAQYAWSFHQIFVHKLFVLLLLNYPKLTNLVMFIIAILILSGMYVNKSIGQIIRELREQKKILVKQVAALLEVDPSLISKIERGDKRPTREQIRQLADILVVDENELMIAYLSDRLVYEIRDEDLAMEAIKVAEQKIEYFKKTNSVV